MKRLTSILFLLFFCFLAVSARHSGKFNPELYQRDLEQFIVAHANLTPQETAVFFPVFREKSSKMRAIFFQIKRLKFKTPADENAAKQAILKQDELDLEMKRLQQYYNNKFLEILPAKKVFQIIKAEDQFHRQAMKKMMLKGKRKKRPTPR